MVRCCGERYFFPSTSPNSTHDFRQTAPSAIPDRRHIVGLGARRDTRQHHWQIELRQRRRLSHDVVVAEIVSAIFDHLGHDLRGRITLHVQQVADIAFG